MSLKRSLRERCRAAANISYCSAGTKSHAACGPADFARSGSPLSALRPETEADMLSTFLAHVDAAVSSNGAQARHWLHPGIISELDRIIFEIVDYVHVQECGLVLGDVPGNGSRSGFDHWRHVGRYEVLSGARPLPSRKIPACVRKLLHDMELIHAESYHLLAKIEDWRGFFYAVSAGLNLEQGQLAYERQELQTALRHFAERFRLDTQHLEDLQTIFDAGWYGRRYPDVTEAGAIPLIHFLTRRHLRGTRSDLSF